jgi:hypothetical protein
MGPGSSGCCGDPPTLTLREGITGKAVVARMSAKPRSVTIVTAS